MSNQARNNLRGSIMFDTTQYSNSRNNILIRDGGALEDGGAPPAHAEHRAGVSPSKLALAATNEDHAQALAALRQQVMALASITGVLVAALRRAGLMNDGLEALLASGLTDAAAARSELARTEWGRMAAAVRKVASSAEKAG